MPQAPLQVAPSTNSKPIFNFALDINMDLKTALREGHRAPASARILSSSKISEKILLELPMQDIILRASLVCTTWKQLIDYSDELQQALFLQPAPGPQGLRLALDTTAEGDEKENIAPKKSGEARQDIAINPLWRRPLRLAAMGFGPRYAGPENSYHRMLFCQPPVHEFGTFRGDEGLKLDGIGWREAMMIGPNEDKLVALYDKKVQAILGTDDKTRRITRSLEDMLLEDTDDSISV